MAVWPPFPLQLRVFAAMRGVRLVATLFRGASRRAGDSVIARSSPQTSALSYPQGPAVRTSGALLPCARLLHAPTSSLSVARGAVLPSGGTPLRSAARVGGSQRGLCCLLLGKRREPCLPLLRRPLPAAALLSCIPNERPPPSTERLPPSGRGRPPSPSRSGPSAASCDPASTTASTTTATATPSSTTSRSPGSGGVGSSPPPPRRPEPPATIPLAALEILPDGTVSARHVQKADVALELSLNLRDLRVVDPTFRNESPVILARPTALVIHLVHVRVLVTASRVLLFDPHHPAVAALTPRLRARLLDAAHPLPFEMRALEAVLVDVCCGIREEVARLKPKVQAALHVMSKEGEFGGHGVTEGLDALLPLEMALNELAGSVGMVRTALNEVLMSDEDMSDMYLSWKAATGEERGVDEHDEIEMMVEGYLKQVDAVVYDLGRLLRAVKTTENVTQIRLDASRNRILRLEVFLNLGAVSVASAACFAGLFGMNLLSGIEEDPYAFWVVSGASAGVALVVFRSVLMYLRWKRIFS